ncbi:GGDEF domain-containing protein [Kineosporia babensis]|uniref:GGDEF domain-containing protein n=1 Tax=Kineosporia babensis TaxID=499548 RepID=A0A9X1NHB3_9ACTN|nr:GGDEF domain-containing protein [Kineosporia babensis]MCD5313266.1 GGDEF domain-containing protein [Kineosporia babensis]
MKQVRPSRSTGALMVRSRPNYQPSSRPANPAPLLAELDALLALVTSEPALAGERAQDLQARAERLGAHQVVAGAVLCRAEACQRRGEIAAAVTLIRQACDGSTPLSGGNRVRASLLKAFVYNDLGDEPTALQHIMDAVLAFSDEVPRLLRVRVLNKAADLLNKLGALEDSLLWYSRAEELAVGDPPVHLMVINNRAYGALLDGRVDDAVAGAQQLSEFSARYGYPLNAAGLDTIARINLLAGDPQTAVEIAQRAVEAALPVDFLTADAGPYYLITLAAAQRSLGRPQEAQATLNQAQKACSAEGYARVKNEILKEQAEILAALGDYRGAYETLQAFNAADRELLSRTREAQARIRQTLFETKAAREEAARYREEARRDPLTGLRNRLYVQERLTELLTAGHPGRLSVALVDLDHFKSVNDDYSHEAGDRVLEAVAGLLEAALPGDDGGSFAARFGGEEFLLVLLTPNRDRAHQIVEQLRRTVQQHDWSYVIPGREITLSAGLATQAPGDTYETLLARADQHLYNAKSSGRNRVSP